MTRHSANVLNILIASPSDVKEEREVVTKAIYDWNAANFMQTGIMLNPVKWESHSYPASGDRPQAIINKQLVEDGDILIGIFGYKLGTPTGVAQSGTIEEIEEFRKGGRYIALYFSTANVPRGADRSQLEALEAYKRERQADTLYFDFEDSESLRDHLTRHLPNIVRAVAVQLQITNSPQPETNEVPPADAELLKIERLMPDLLAEMRKDLSEKPLCREFIVISKRLTFVYPNDRVILTYFTEDLPDLLEKVRILENYGLVRDIKHNDVPRYAISEKLAEYLGTGPP